MTKKSKPDPVYAEAAAIVSDAIMVYRVKKVEFGGDETGAFACMQTCVHNRLRKAAQAYGAKLESIVIDLLLKHGKRT